MVRVCVFACSCVVGVRLGMNGSSALYQNLGPEMPYLSIFGLQFENSIVMF